MRTLIPALLLSLSLVGCDDKGTSGDDTAVTPVADADGDGFVEDVDCDDADPAIYPGAPETCDGVDNDCDQIIDEDPVDGTTWYGDADGDGYGGQTFTQSACSQPTGYVSNDDDCDDLSARALPGGVEVCDGLDNDCNGEVDDGATGTTSYYIDADGDGYGDPDTVVESCAAPSGYVDQAGDCDDTDAAVNPDTVWYIDLDGDGYGSTATQTTACEAPVGWVANADDCDDSSGVVYPGADERCDGADDDCDGDVDEDDAVDAVEWYLDDDGDGYGQDAAVAVACAAPSGYASQGGDCDDTNIGVYPWAPETCDDGIDQDCNGVVDNTCYDEHQITDVAWSMSGGSSYDYFGYDVRAGDLDGDGSVDVLAGAYGEDDGGSSAGAAYVIYGALSGGSSVSQADAVIMGQNASDYLGNTVQLLDDMDGDGFVDLAVSASGNDEGASSGGKVYVFQGPISGTIDGIEADAFVYGSTASDYMGRYCTAAGDLNGDGLSDLVSSSYGYGAYQGAIYGFFGPVSAGTADSAADVTVTGDEDGAYTGYGMLVHDLDGDGQDDLVFGEPGTDQGSAYIAYGPLSGSLSGATADEQIMGEAGDDFFGTLFSAGDFNGDGHADLAVSAKYEATGASDGGAWYVFYGPVSGGLARDHDFKIYSEQTYDYFGHQESNAAAGDLNADGTDDLVMGWPADDSVGSNFGSVLVVYGPMSGMLTVEQADEVIEGADGGSYVGQSVDVADFDGDGLGDILVGAKYDSDDHGSVSVFLGADL